MTHEGDRSPFVPIFQILLELVKRDRVDVADLAQSIRRIEQAVGTLSTQTQEKLMAVSAQIQAFSDRVNDATNEIASDLQALRDKVAAGTQLSAEDAALLDAAATRLEAMGVDPEDPVPVPLPVVPPDA